ncbi:MAG TPA: hypothetical protein VGD53_00450 [Actinoallomurus sp.]
MTQPPPYQPPYQGPGPYQQQPYPQQPGQGPYQAPGGYQQPQGQPYQQPQYQQPQYQQPYPPQYGQPQYGQQYQQYQGAPQAYPQQYQAPQQQAGYQAQGQGTCRICGSGPAAQATFRAVVGAVFMHTIWTAPGPYCRDCGMHTFRRQTAKTLGGGWCSIGAIVLTPIFLLMNLSARGKVANLPAPQLRGDGRAPLDPGPSVFQRPVAYVYPAMGMILLLLIIVGNLSG